MSVCLPPSVSLNDLLAAVLDVDEERLRALLLVAPVLDLNARLAKGKTLLHLAVEKESLALVRTLVCYCRCGRVSSGDNAAETSNTVETTASLASGNESGNSAESVCVNALLMATSGGQMVSDHRCKNSVVDVNVQEESRQYTPLHIAIKRNCLDIVRLLVLQGNAAIDIGNQNRATSLHWAAQHGTKEILLFLVQQAALDTAQLQQNITSSGPETTTQLLAKGNNTASRAIKQATGRRRGVGRTASKEASPIFPSTSTTTSVKNILEIPDSSGWYPIHAAIYAGKQDCFEVLVSHGANIHQTGHRGWSCLQISSFTNNMSLSRRLVDLGVDIQVNADDGTTPLQSACERGHVSIAKFLLQQGANVNKSDKEGWTSLHSASFAGSLELVKILVQEYQADVSRLTLRRQTAFDLAVEKERIDVAAWLLVEADCKCVALLNEINTALGENLASGPTSPAMKLSTPATSTSTTTTTTNSQTNVNLKYVVSNMVKVLNRIGGEGSRKINVQPQTLRTRETDYPSLHKNNTQSIPTNHSESNLSTILPNTKPTTTTHDDSQSRVRLLTSFMDSHFGSIMDELLLNDHAASFSDVARRLMERWHDCTQSISTVRDGLDRLMGQESDEILTTIQEIQQLQESYSQIDIQPLLTLISHTLLKQTSEWIDQQTHIDQLNTEELTIRSLSSHASKILSEYDMLIDAKCYLDALNVEEVWMRQCTDILEKKSNLLKRCELLLRRQRQLCAETTLLASEADLEASKIKADLEVQVAAMTERLSVLSTFKQRVTITVERVGEEWRSKHRYAPWLMAFLSEYKQYVIQQPTMTDIDAVQSLLDWYVEEKAGEALREHTKISACLSVLDIHISIVEKVCSEVLEPGFSYTTTALNYQINALQGQCHALQEDVPITHLALHKRLVQNEQLCSTNLTDLQCDLSDVLSKKNRAFENRRVGDLAMFQEDETKLGVSVEKERIRLSRIEELVVRSFAIIEQHVSVDQQAILRQELLNAGYKQAEELGQSRKRKRREDEMDQDDHQSEQKSQHDNKTKEVNSSFGTLRSSGRHHSRTITTADESIVPDKKATVASREKMRDRRRAKRVVRYDVMSVDDTNATTQVRETKRQRTSILGMMTWPIRQLVILGWRAMTGTAPVVNRSSKEEVITMSTQQQRGEIDDLGVDESDLVVANKTIHVNGDERNSEMLVEDMIALSADGGN